MAGVSGCATLGGTTRHFDEVSTGTPVIRSSQRLTAHEQIEISTDVAPDQAAIRARVSRALTCHVQRSTPRTVTRTTTQTASPVLFGAEVVLTLVGAVITAASLSSALKACPNGDPDTCDISKATAWAFGTITAPFLTSTAIDLALTGGTERSTRQSAVDSIQSESIETCGHEPVAGVTAKLALPSGTVLERTSDRDGAVLFELAEDQLPGVGAQFDVQLSVEGAAPISIQLKR